LTRVAAAHPDAELFFLMGLDSLRDLPTWQKANSIGQLAQLGVAQRPGVEMDIDAVLDQLPDLRGRVHVCSTPGIDLSATLLRDRVAAGKSIRYMTPESVRRYILDHGLYSTPPENRPTSQSASSR
jgi:nicotinate-nucleotide adenylyltransferase